MFPYSYEYDYSYAEIDGHKYNGDVKKIININSYPLDEFGEQIGDNDVMAKVILSTHNDVIVMWTYGEAINNTELIKLVEKAKIEIQEYR